MLLKLLEARDPQAPVLFQNNRAALAGELASKARSLAGALAARNVGESDRVALVLPNCRELVVALAACARLGAVAAPLDPTWTAPELARALAALAPRAAFVLGRGASALLAAAEAAELEPPLLVRIDSDSESPGAAKAAFLDELLALNLPAPPAPPARAAFLAHTAWRGRGRPHFALIGPEAALEGAVAAARAAGIDQACKDGSLLAAGPFHRPGPLALHVLAPVVMGIPFVVLKQLRARMALMLAHTYPVRAVVGPSALLSLMARLVGTGQERAPEGVRSWTSTGSPPPGVGQVELIEQTFGRPLGWGYGSAEAAWSLMVPDARRSLPAASRGLGEPIAPSVAVHLLEDGAPVATGRPGAIHVRAPWAAREFLGEAPEDRPVPLGVPTGDRAVRSSDGTLHLVPREDTCYVAGYEVDLVEVAAVLQEHPSVAIAQAFAVPDPETGAHVRAVVSLRPDKQASIADLIDFLRARLTFYKIPQSFRFKKLERPS